MKNTCKLRQRWNLYWCRLLCCESARTLASLMGKIGLVQLRLGFDTTWDTAVEGEHANVQHKAGHIFYLMSWGQSDAADWEEDTVTSAVCHTPLSMVVVGGWRLIQLYLQTSHQIQNPKRHLTMIGTGKREEH